ncbi:hypothetical protein AC579_240 [Pseudocercospora musae]|uniref:C2H2-type domain-containing protein n=1 Tax=Pseudocercospora musae TaxID=113226 RepID=A0A139I4A0_9PEZI|nr:hypothetical protein AC579_240 [Pseudocercospora musae]
MSSSSSRHSRRGPPVYTSKMINCNYCEESFARSEHLDRHMLVHTNPKPFSCLQCNQSFSRREALKRHYQSHEPKPKSSRLNYSVKTVSTSTTTTTQPGPQYVVYTGKSGDRRPQLSLRIPSTSEGIADVTKYLLSTAHPEESSPSSSSSCCSSAYTDIAPMLGWSSSQSTTSWKKQRGVEKRSNYPRMSETPR